MCRLAAAQDSHHITDRKEIINGGYVLENGISLCSACHWKAEQYHITGEAAHGYSSRRPLQSNWFFL